MAGGVRGPGWVLRSFPTQTIPWVFDSWSGTWIVLVDWCSWGLDAHRAWWGAQDTCPNTGFQHLSPHQPLVCLHLAKLHGEKKWKCLKTTALIVNKHLVVLMSCIIPGSCLSPLSIWETSNDQVKWAEVFGQGNLHEVSIFHCTNCSAVSEFLFAIQFGSGGIFASFQDMYNVFHLFVSVQQNLNLLHSILIN